MNRVIQRVVSALLLLALSFQTMEIRAIDAEPQQIWDYTIELVELYPGLAVKRSITLDNPYEENVKVYLKSIEVLNENNLAKKLIVTVPFNLQPFHGSNIKTDYDELLFELSSGDTKNFDIQISLDTTAGNEVQGLETTYRLTFILQGGETVVPNTGVDTFEWWWLILAGTALIIIGKIKRKEKENET